MSNSGRRELEHKTETKTGMQREEEILEKYPLPAHWHPIAEDASFRGPRQAFFSLLCFSAFGYVGLEKVWIHMKLDEADENGCEGGGWAEKSQMVGRTNNMVVVVRLHLTSEGFSG